VEAESSDKGQGDEGQGDEETRGQGEGETELVSRIVIEFNGLGEADVVRALFENISLGQMLAFARYAEWQCQRAIAQYERAERAEAERKAKLQKIVVPGMGLMQ